MLTMLCHVSTEIKLKPTPPPPSSDPICGTWYSLPLPSTVVNSGLLLTWLTTVNDGPLTMQGVNDGNVTVNDGLAKVNEQRVNDG